MVEVLLNYLKEEKEIKLKGRLYHRTQIKLAYNSNRIEGSKLTEEQTRFIFETNTLYVENNQPTNIDDIIETINHFLAFDYIIEQALSDITEEIIKHIHFLIKDNTTHSRKEWFKVGEYKVMENIVGDTRTTLPKDVEKDMHKLLSDYHKKDIIKIEDILWFHYCFEKIHPFQDGNGRVGRLIMFKECLKHNITPFIIDEKHKFYYYRGLKEYENNVAYLVDTCLSAQDSYQLEIDYFYPSYNKAIKED